MVIGGFLPGHLSGKVIIMHIKTYIHTAHNDCEPGLSWCFRGMIDFFLVMALSSIRNVFWRSVCLGHWTLGMSIFLSPYRNVTTVINTILNVFFVGKN